MFHYDLRLPPHSSIMFASCSTCGPAILSMLFMPSKTTWITWVSLQFSRLQNGGITPSWISRATCSLLPLIVRLLIAHAASFCVWNSPYQQKLNHLSELIVLKNVAPSLSILLQKNIHINKEVTSEQCLI